MKTFKFVKQKNVLTFSNKTYKLVVKLNDKNIEFSLNNRPEYNFRIETKDQLHTLIDFLDDIHHEKEDFYVKKYIYPYTFSFYLKGKYVDLNIGHQFIQFTIDDLPEFNKFIDAIFKYSKYMNDNPKFQILNASHTYITEMQEYKISFIAETMIAVLDDETKTLDSQFAVFEYPGIVEKVTPTLKKLFKPQLDKRYNIGIFAIKKGGDHYLSFILDNKTNELWAFDSLATDSLSRPLALQIYGELYPTHNLYSTQICSGCKKYEPLWTDEISKDEDYVDQNIFCHTWSLWFIYQMLEGVKNGKSIGELFLLLNNSCGTPRENLITIKKFILWLSANVLDGLNIPHLNKIFDKLDTGLDIHEFIVDSTQLPETFDWDILENLEDPSRIDFEDETDEQRRIRLTLGGWI